jgi:hypothetical protein
MKTIRFALTLLFVTSIFYSQNKVSDLIVEIGQTKKLSAGKYKYHKVHIKSGATLEFLEGSSTWAIINCDEFVLDGNIVFNSFNRGMGKIKETTEDGFHLQYTFPETSLGGNGGDGARSYQTNGGKGFISKNNNGGGGGAGAQETKNSIKSGEDARGINGGSVFINTAYSIGGNGGKCNNINGGLLSINANTFNSNENSWIYLNGNNGKNGENGLDGSVNNNDLFSNIINSFSGGGGGGGCAGGDGGVLIVRATKYIGKHPQVNINGGFGGKGGRRGETFDPPLFDALNGKDGENGKDGYFSWLLK